MLQSHSIRIPNHFVPCVASCAINQVDTVLKRSLPNRMKTVSLSEYFEVSTNIQAKLVKQPLATTLFSKKQVHSPGNAIVANIQF